MIGLLGATGFTGRLTARWLAENTDAAICLAGRDPAALAKLARSLPRDVEVQVCDVQERATLTPLMDRCRVVLSTAGPFVRLGPNVVREAVARGCHYVDITGEAGFVRWSRLHFDATARDRGLRVVHCAGFDALPHDVGAWRTRLALPDGPVEVNGYVSTGAGQPSGGTWRSAMLALGEGLPGGSPQGVCSRLHRADGAFAVPLPTVDAQIVLWTAEELGYGDGFRYGHHARIERFATLLAGAIGVGGILAATRVPALRRWLTERVPAGSGPDEALRSQGWMRGLYVGTGGGRRAVSTVRTERDAGYTTTAAWLGTCGLLLDEGRDLPERAGVLTPVAAFGEALLDRLPSTGTTVETRVEA